MRTVFSFLLLLFSYCVNVDGQTLDDLIGKPNNNKNVLGSNDKQKGSDKEIDDEKHLYYPCKHFRFEEECVSRLLASTGQCKEVNKLEQKKIIYREKAVLYLPSFNLTVVITDAKITGLDGKIDKFYVNKTSGNLIYAVNFDTISVDSDTTYFEFQRRGKEPIVTYDFFKVTFFSVYLTAVIPINHGLSLKESRVTAYVGNNRPNYVIGPRIGANPDPVVQTTLLEVNTNVPIAVQEAYLTEATNFYIAYLQNYICDFGIKV